MHMQVAVAAVTPRHHVAVPCAPCVPAEPPQEVFGLERYDLIGLDMEERKMGAFFTQVKY